MTQILFADLKLARRLEAADVWLKLSYVEAQAQRLPEIDTATERVEGGCAVYAGPHSPLNRAVGLGMTGPVSADELLRMEQFFHGRGVAARVELCPLAHPSLLDWLNSRGYCLKEFKNVWVRPLRDHEFFPSLIPGVQTREANSREAGLWIRTVSQGFAGQNDVTLGGVEIAMANFYLPTAACFLAWVDDQAAGGGAMATHAGLATFFSASTRPAFRGHGVQTELLRARLTAAIAAGCDLAMVHTVPGTASQRNVQRFGFQLAYTKMAMVKKPNV